MSEGKRVVYIAGPMTVGDWEGNKRAAIDAAEELAAAGFVPLIPHLSATWHLVYPHDHAFWLELDLALVARCDALLRLPGESKGADLEVARAKELGKPTYSSLHVLKRELGVETFVQVMARGGFHFGAGAEPPYYGLCSCSHNETGERVYQPHRPCPNPAHKPPSTRPRGLYILDLLEDLKERITKLEEGASR